MRTIRFLHALGQRSCSAMAAMLLIGGCDGISDIESTSTGRTGGSRSTNGSSAGAGGSSGEIEPIGDRRIPFTPEGDREFVDFFVAHHEMAVEMAEHEVMHGEDAKVKAMAQGMIDIQSPEINQMKMIAAGLADPPTAPLPTDPHAQADMAQMSMIHGAALDGMFIIEMIAHRSRATGSTSSTEHVRATGSARSRPNYADSTGQRDRRDGGDAHKFGNARCWRGPCARHRGTHRHGHGG